MLAERTIMLIDDHPLIRLGLRGLIEACEDLRVVAEAGSIKEALEMVEEMDPDVAVVDLNLPDGSGIDLVRSIKKVLPHVKILVLSLHDGALYGQQCRRAGADGYLMKESAALGIVEQLYAVIRGEGWANVAMDEDPRATLSRRELQVMAALGGGEPPRVIAAQLGLSVKTVETHLAHCKQKLGVQHMNELVRLAIAWRDSL